MTLSPFEVLERLTLLGPRLLVQKANIDTGLVLLPFDNMRETSCCKILDVGEECRFFDKTHIDGFAQLPMKHNGIRRYGNPEWGFALVTEEALQHGIFCVFWPDEPHEIVGF